MDQLAVLGQLASERRIVRSRGQPVRRFERKPSAAAEALDCLVYAWAAKALLTINLDDRASSLAGTQPPPPPTSVPLVEAW